MRGQTLQVLLVDDDKDDYLIIRDLLSKIDEFSCRLDWQDSYASGLEAMRRQQYDVCLLDYYLGKRNGLELLQEALNCGIKTPFILLTGRGDRTIDSQAIQAGAADYLVKQQITVALLQRSIRHALERQRIYKALRRSEELYVIAAQGANDGLWDWNIETGEVYYSPRWKAQLGFVEDEIGVTIDEWFSRVHSADIERLKEAFDEHLRGLTSTFDNEHRVRHKNGDYRWMLTRGLALRDTSGHAYHIAGWQTDSSERVAAYDGLTNLPNRALFLDRLQRALTRAKRKPGYRFAVLFLDLDQFKVVNDSLGHFAGDLMLIEVGRRLEESLRATDIVGRLRSDSHKAQPQNNQGSRDTIARFGGDEFAILTDEIYTAQDAIRIAERIHKSLSRPFRIADQDICSSASIGIALSSSHYERTEEILRDADIAMYKAKESGKACYTLFNSEMHVRIQERMTLEADLRQAFQGQEFSLHYQPIVSVGGELRGFEALLRWQSGVRGWVPPSAFIPLAKESELIIAIGRWVITQACRQLQHWRKMFPQIRQLSVSVNLSGMQLGHGCMVDHIREILTDTSLEAQALALEVTEGILAANVGTAIEELEQLRQLGVRVHIDDFGTGYSSLSRLRQLPADVLKIDRSFVSGIGTDAQSQGIVQAILGLGRTLDLGVIAEGVETATQLSLLRDMQCDWVQGFYIAKPLAPDAVTVFLNALKSSTVALNNF